MFDLPAFPPFFSVFYFLSLENSPFSPLHWDAVQSISKRIAMFGSFCLPLGPELKRLVGAQRFEDAARVRDRLRQLKGDASTACPVATAAGPFASLPLLRVATSVLRFDERTDVSPACGACRT